MKDPLRLFLDYVRNSLEIQQRFLEKCIKILKNPESRRIILWVIKLVVLHFFQN